MLYKLLFGVLVAFSIAIVVSPGCDGDGGGDGDQPSALSFDGDTSIPATGGAAIATDSGRGLGSVISAMVSALVVDDASEPSNAAPKALLDVELPICENSGGAMLSGDLIEAVLTFEDCVGSPLSSEAVNGRILVDVDTGRFSIVPGDTEGPVYAVPGTATLAGPAEDGSESLLIGESTRLSGGFAIQADVSLSSDSTVATAVDLTLGARTARDLILVTQFIPGVIAPPGESTEPVFTTLELGCFEVAMSLGVDPPSIDAFSIEGVLNLNGEIYSVRSEDVGFGAVDGVAIPIAGSLELSSGGECGATFPGDGSTATAAFGVNGEGASIVDITATGPDGQSYRCASQSWESLLDTLKQTTGFESCPCVANCGTGGTGGSAGTGGTAGSGGTGGTAGDGGSPGTGGNEPPVINWVGWEYPQACTGQGDTMLIVSISAYDADGDVLVYSGSVDWCDSPISITSADSPVEQTLTDCFSGSLTMLSVTVEDPGGETDSITAEWESAICEEDCVEGDDDLIQENCPSPWPSD